jgi:hypothetical protein
MKELPNTNKKYLDVPKVLFLIMGVIIVGIIALTILTDK